MDDRDALRLGMLIERLLMASMTVHQEARHGRAGLNAEKSYTVLGRTLQSVEWAAEELRRWAEERGASLDG
jgi:hypothetical protein